MLVFGIFFPVIRNTYLFHDDYPNFQQGSGRCIFSPINIDWYTKLGRPFAGWLLCGYSSLIQTPEDGSFVRFLVLISIAIMSYLFYVYMVRNDIVPLKSILLASLILTVPSVAIYAFWITASFMVIGNIFSIISGLLIYFVIEKRFQGIKKNIFFFLSAIFFISSALIYQPSAMVYWGLLAFSLWNWISEKGEAWVGKTIQMTGFGIFCMGLYGISYISTTYQELKVADPSRSIHTLASTFAKFQDFFSTTIPTIHGLWFNNPISWFPWALFVIIVSGIVVASDLSISKKLVLFLAYPALCIISFVPVLISNFPDTFFRTMFPIWVVVIAYLSGSIQRIFQLFDQKFRAEEFLITISLVFGIVLQFYFVRDTLVKPAVFELSFVKERISSILNKDHSLKRTIILCPLHYRLISQLNSDEYGSPTSAFNQDIPSLVINILRDGQLNKEIALVWENSCISNKRNQSATLDLTNMLKTNLWPAMQPISLQTLNR